MAIVSLKKNKVENAVVVSRVSSDVVNTLRYHNVNISKTVREYLVSIAENLKSVRPKRSVS